MLVGISSGLNESNNDTNHEIAYELNQVEDLLLNPYQTLPKERYIQVTTSFCDHAGNSDKAHDDTILFDWEISAAFLYTWLREHVKYYDDNYHLQCSIRDIEDWLIVQKSLFHTVSKESEFLEESGLTVANFPTEYGSIDFFIEYGFSYPEEIWND